MELMGQVSRNLRDAGRKYSSAGWLGASQSMRAVASSLFAEYPRLADWADETWSAGEISCWKFVAVGIMQPSSDESLVFVYRVGVPAARAASSVICERVQLLRGARCTEGDVIVACKGDTRNGRLPCVISMKESIASQAAGGILAIFTIP